MLFYFSILILSILHITDASSRFPIGNPNTALIPRSGFVGDIVARQTTTCQAECDPITDLLDNNCQPAECCQASFLQAAFNCFLCVGNATNTTDYSVPQAALDNLTEACDSRGFNAPKLTLPGINPNRTLSTASGSGSSQTGFSIGSLPTNTGSGPSTVSIATSVSPILPPGLTTATSQNVIGPSSPSVPSDTNLPSPSPPQPSNTPSVAIPQRLLTPRLTYLSISTVLLSGLFYFIS